MILLKQLTALCASLLLCATALAQNAGVTRY